MIETDRLRLRKPLPSDQTFFTRLYGNPEVMAHIPPDRKAASPEEAEERLGRILSHWQAHGYGMFVVVLKDDPEQEAGYCGLRFLPETRDIELGYIIDQPFWGMGIASEAAWACVDYARGVLGAGRLVSMTDPGNRGSQRILEKLGFVPSASDDGVYHGMHHAFFVLNLDGPGEVT